MKLYNAQQLTDELNKDLKSELNRVSVKVVEKLTDGEHRLIESLLRAHNTLEDCKTIQDVLARAKFRIPKKMFYHYRKTNDLDKDLKKKPFDQFVNYEEIERAGALRINDYSII